MMNIDKLDGLEAHDLASVELRKRHPNMHRFGKLVERMIADIPNDERTWRLAGKLYERAGWYDKAIAAYTRCAELGNETAWAAVARVQALQQGGRV